MIQGFDNAKTLPACDALVGCVIAADHVRLRISIHCVFYASGEKVARFGAIEILPTYTPEAGCPRRGFQPCIQTMKFRLVLVRGRTRVSLAHLSDA